MEVYTLPDAANASIPPEIREQFERDEQGRVLFFTSPPIQVFDPKQDASEFGHSIEYMATKFRREEETAKKRKAFAIAKAEAQLAKKKAKIEEAKALQGRMEGLKRQALGLLEDQLVKGTVAQMQSIYGREWKSAADSQFELLAVKQKEALERRSVVERHEREKLMNESVRLGAAGTLMEDE